MINGVLKVEKNDDCFVLTLNSATLYLTLFISA